MENAKAKKKAKRSLYLWIIIAILAVVGGTYAWFTFQTSTNVDPNTAGTVTDGKSTLLISNSPNGPFKEQCDLVFMSHGENLDPISTADLSGFYKAAAQNAAGISVLFSDASGEINSSTMHGKLYLKTEGESANVYLYKNRMTFGNSTQAIAAMRLGMKITTNSGEYRYIFKLDDMADTSEAEKKATTTEKNVVIKSVSNGKADFAPDPGLAITPYSSIGKTVDDKEPAQGEKPLLTIKSGQIATVEYWLYLEGCDENCINSVQKKTVEFRLSFAGGSVK